MTDIGADVNNKGKVGFFDSGLGGLLILKAVAKELPRYDYLFYGDTANLPLGDKTEEEIYEHTKAGIEALFLEGAILVIIACNTASAETLRRLQDGFLAKNYPDRRILGVIIPTVEELIESDSRSALLIATRRTVESGKYELELKNRAPRPIEITSMATPGLVPLIEDGAGELALGEAVMAIEAERRKKVVDTVILGCTHYAKLKDGLRVRFGQDLKFLSQDEIIPKKLADYLDRHPEIEKRLGQGGTRSIKLTLHRPDYDMTIQELLGGVIL